jgi:hypothetical protein
MFWPNRVTTVMRRTIGIRTGFVISFASDLRKLLRIPLLSWLDAKSDYKVMELAHKLRTCYANGQPKNSGSVAGQPSAGNSALLLKN